MKAVRVKDDALLDSMLRMAVDVLKPISERTSHSGPGHPFEYQPWQVAAMMLVATLRRCKSKGSQYRFIKHHQHQLLSTLELERIPSRSTFYQRYRQGYGYLSLTLVVHARVTLEELQFEPEVAAVDKTLIPAKGKLWHNSQRQQGKCPPGVDREADWGFSNHHRWVWGYGLETMVTADQDGYVVPLAASVEPANVSETQSVKDKIWMMPESLNYLLADAGYDSNALQQLVEDVGQCTFICPLQKRAGDDQPGQTKRRGERERQRQARIRRHDFYHSPEGQTLYARRSQTTEPFHEWIKELFDLHHHAWHRGLSNNRAQLLLALFAYQLMLRVNHALGNRNAAVTWILDAL